MDNTTNRQIDLLSLIADDKSIVTYRPRWNQLTGSIAATILLQQLIYRWVNNKRQPFYKFTRPCDHPLCRPGDTWVEELGLTRHEFEAARGRIAARTHGDIDPHTFISYWTTSGHLTWYAVNETLLVEQLSALYPMEPAAVGVQLPIPTAEPFPKNGNGDSENRKRQIRKVETPFPKSGNGHHDPFPKTGNGVSENRKQIYRDDLIDNIEQRSPETTPPTTTSPPAAEPPTPPAGGGGDVPAILHWAGFTDRLNSQEQTALDPTTALAWCYFIHLEESKPTRPKNAIGLARSRWRANTPPPPDLLALADIWLRLDDDGRRAVLDGCQYESQWGHAGAAFEGIDDLPVTAAIAVYRATAGELAPPSLTPAREPAAPAAATAEAIAEVRHSAAPPPASLWKDALADLELQMTRSTFKSWLACSTATLDGDTLTVHLANAYAVDWVTNRLNDLIRRTVAAVTGRPLTIHYEVRQ